MAETIQIEFVDRGVIGERIVGKYRWDASNGFVTGVDVETAANLITYPTPQFAAVKGQGVSAAAIKKLADLMNVKEEEVRALFAAESAAAPSNTEAAISAPLGKQELNNGK